MGVYTLYFHCVELVSKKSEISANRTRWGATKHCHKLNKWNPQERWTVKPLGYHYLPDCYIEQPKETK